MNNPQSETTRFLLDSDGLSDFIAQHPLRFLCKRTSEVFLLKRARFLAFKGANRIQGSESYPFTPHTLEERIKKEGITIEEFKIRPPLRVLDNPKFTIRNLPPPIQPAFLAWSDTESRRIHLDTGAIKQVLQSSQDSAKRGSLSYKCARAILLAHEWFHLLFEEITKPPDWNELPKPERIIIEETAARIFSIQILDAPPGVFPTGLGASSESL